MPSPPPRQLSPNETDAPADPGSADEAGDEAGGAAPAAGLSDACTTALDDVQAAQDVVADKQDALQKALQDLSATMTSAVKTINDSSSDSSPTPTTSTPKTTTPTTTPSTAAGSSGGSSSKGSGSSGDAGTGAGTVTAATLAKDQASIDTATAQLTEARRSLSSAKLTAPFGGQILSVSVVKGDVVGATDVAVVIAGDGGTTVTTTATLDQIDSVKTSQTASVTPAGASKPAGGTVSSIGLLPSTSGDSTTATYPVTIDLDEDVPAPEGSVASIELVIGTATDVLTVPSSAVSTGGRSTVTLLTDGNPVVTPVTVGVVGSTRTSITEGLKKGQQVVIGDLAAGLPSGDSASTRLPGAGAQGRPPGGGPGGGRG
jgi:HlyD family secretion protein